MVTSTQQREILESWKEISSYLNRDVKTCQRWEQNLDLPIRRLDGTPRARVFAYKEEIDYWLEDKLNNREITTTKYLRIVKKKPKKFWIALPVGLALIFTAVVILRLIPPLTFVSSVPEKSYLAVLPISNLTGDESLGNLRPALTNLIVADLSQSIYIRVLSEERMNTILEKMNLFDKDSFTTKDLKKIASQEKITHFLKGSVNKFGESLRLTVSTQEVRNWKKTWTGQKEGTADDIFTMVDDLTAELKPHLNLTNKQITADFDKRIEDVTTPDRRALQLYFEAKEALNKTEWDLAIDLFERAIAQDPDFAMAYRMLSGLYNHLGLQFQQQVYWDKMREFGKKAYEAALRRPPSERERLIIEGLYQKDVPAEMEAYKRLVELYPDDDYGNYRLGVRYAQEYNYNQAEVHLKRITGFTNNWTAFFWLGDIYLDQGRYREAEELFETGIRMFPNNWFFCDWMAELHILQREFLEASFWCDKGLEIEPVQFRDSLRRGDVFFFGEDFPAAEKEYRQGLQSENSRARIKATDRLVHLYKTQGRFKDVRMQAESTKQTLTRDRIVDFDAINRELALLLAQEGKFQEALELSDEIGHPPFQSKLRAEILTITNSWAEAEQYLEEREQNFQSHEQLEWIVYELKNGMEGIYRKQVRHAIHILKIRIALEQGKYQEVIQTMEEAKSVFPGINSIPADLIELSGFAFYKLGEWEAARKEYEWITRMTYSRLEHGDIYAKSFFMLGKIFEQEGREGDARRNYERFLELWKNADPGLPEIYEAKARLATL